MKRKRECELELDSVNVPELSNILYESIYSISSSSRPLPFFIQKKKLEEAEGIFSHALSSSSSTCTCIVFKGPTACGKGFLTASLLEKFKESIRLSELDSLPDTLDFGSFLSPPSAAVVKCGNTLFPSLSFTSKNRNNHIHNHNHNLRTAVVSISDSFFQGKSYHQIKGAIEMLRTHSGIVIFEISDFEFDGSMNNVITKLLNETFSTNIRILNINACTPTSAKKILQPLSLHFGINISNIVDRFSGDIRALFHDLYFYSLHLHLNRQNQKRFTDNLKNNTLTMTMRDYRTDFFHYVGKMLYPAKSDSRIFDDISFWDINHDLFLIFLQYYFPFFSSNLVAIAKVTTNFCEYDVIPWHVAKHISMDSHHQTATSYAPLLSCYLTINDPNRSNSSQKFFSFNRPPKIYSSSEYLKQIRKRQCKPEDFLLMESLLQKNNLDIP